MNRILCDNHKLLKTYYVYEAFRYSDYFKTAGDLYLDFGHSNKTTKSQTITFDENILNRILSDPYIANIKKLVISLNDNLVDPLSK